VTPFELAALLLITAWLAAVAIWFHRSTPVLLGGLIGTGALTLVAMLLQGVSLPDLGLDPPRSWLATVALALAWAAIMYAYSPVADRLASRWFAKPPTLGAFRAIQESKAKLILGIVVAWALGGILEELVFRGVLLNAAERGLAGWMPEAAAALVAIGLAAVGAGVIHLYQGSRAAAIITQLSVLFGLLFVVSGHNLWAVILCHGVYDTIAFIRFAMKKSKYSNLDGDAEAAS